MAELLRAHGLRLGALIALLVAVWVAALIVAPLATLAARSSQVPEPAAVAARLEIDRLHQELTAVRRDWERATDAEMRADLDRRTRLVSARLTSLERLETDRGTRWSLDGLSRFATRHAAALAGGLGRAALVTLIALLAAYPVAHAAATGRHPRSTVLVVAVLVVFALAEPLRAWAWATTVDPNGPLARALVRLGLLAPGDAAAILPGADAAAGLATMVYAHLPVTILPIWLALRRLDPRLIEAARDLGASTARIHARIVLPHARPGIVVGSLLTFVLSAGAYAVPRIAGADRATDWFGPLVWRHAVGSLEADLAAASAVTLGLACLVAAATAAATGLLGLRRRGVLPRSDRHA